MVKSGWPVGGWIVFCVWVLGKGGETAGGLGEGRVGESGA